MVYDIVTIAKRATKDLTEQCNCFPDVQKTDHNVKAIQGQKFEKYKASYKQDNFSKVFIFVTQSLLLRKPNELTNSAELKKRFR